MIHGLFKSPAIFLFPHCSPHPRTLEGKSGSVEDNLFQGNLGGFSNLSLAHMAVNFRSFISQNEFS